REALAGVMTVDVDADEIVIRARIQLHPEFDRVGSVTRDGPEVISDEFAVRFGSVIEFDIDAGRGIFQANVGHPPALAFVRADTHVEPWLLDRRFSLNERERSGVFGVGQTLAGGGLCWLGVGLVVELRGTRLELVVTVRKAQRLATECRRSTRIDMNFLVIAMRQGRDVARLGA